MKHIFDIDIFFVFFYKAVLQPGWASNLVSAYYPLLMTCASLVVCLWAEVSISRKCNFFEIFYLKIYIKTKQKNI